MILQWYCCKDPILKPFIFKSVENANENAKTEVIDRRRNFQQSIHNTREHTQTCLATPWRAIQPIFSTSHAQYRRWYCYVVWCSLVNIQQAGYKDCFIPLLWKADSILCNVQRHSLPGKQELCCSGAEEGLERILKLTLTEAVLPTVHNHPALLCASMSCKSTLGLLKVSSVVEEHCDGWAGKTGVCEICLCNGQEKTCMTAVEV